ncbi:MAG TPA: class I SAM-dependent methyltransferase [Dongiaceae bacterium]|nr:class I SAM-dependent methyltransferase [Dongiaceae bacterium]
MLMTDLSGPIVDADQLAGDILEPLVESAPIAFETAMSECASADGMTGCQAYHAIWQYLRLTDVIRAVRVDGPLFAAAVKAQAARGPLRRILISGTADYSMLAYLGHAARIAGASPAFDVIDRCATTLSMNEWYGARRGLDVRTVLTDVNAYRPTERYDLICTHSFLYWAAGQQRSDLFRNWHDWLAPEGRLCFSNRIEPSSPLADTVSPSSRVQAMVSEFFRRRAELGIVLPVPDREFESLIRSYARRPARRVRDLTMQRLQAHFDEVGLVAETAVKVADVVPGHRDKISAPVQSEGRPRFWFQARRA